MSASASIAVAPADESLARQCCICGRRGEGVIDAMVAAAGFGQWRGGGTDQLWLARWHVLFEYAAKRQHVGAICSRVLAGGDRDRAMAISTGPLPSVTSGRSCCWTSRRLQAADVGMFTPAAWVT